MPSEYDLPEYEEKPYEEAMGSTDHVVESFREKAMEYSKEESKESIQDEYEPSEGITSKYEELQMKRLEKLGVLPGGIMKYVNPIRKKLKSLFMGYK